MTVEHTVRTYSSKEELPREEQLAHKLASVATDPVAVEPEVVRECPPFTYCSLSHPSTPLC